MDAVNHLAPGADDFLGASVGGDRADVHLETTTTALAAIDGDPVPGWENNRGFRYCNQGDHHGCY